MRRFKFTAGNGERLFTLTLNGRLAEISPPDSVAQQHLATLRGLLPLDRGSAEIGWKHVVTMSETYADDIAHMLYCIIANKEHLPGLKYTG